MNKRMIVMLLMCTVVFGGIFGFKWFGKTMMNRFFDNMPIPPATITADTVKTGTWRQTLTAVGTVRAIQGVQVTTEMPGLIDAIEFESGRTVAANEVLVRLNAKTDYAELNALKAAAALAQLELDRAIDLHRKKSISKAEVDLKKSTADQAQARVDAQQERIAQKVIRSPFKGVLGLRQVDVGQFIAAGTPIVSLQSLAPIYVNFSLPEQRHAEIAVGMPITVTLSGDKNNRLEGQISAIEPGINPNTRQFEIQATFSNDPIVLRPGMFANVQFEYSAPAEKLIIPRTAVSFTPYGNAVFVVETSVNDAGEATTTVLKRFIKTGAERGDLIVVETGLAAGDTIATSGLLKLQNHTHVIISEDFAPATALDPEPENR